MGCIYKVTNSVTGKVYIGQTVRNIEIRWKEHVRHSLNKNNNERTYYFHRAIKKYGQENFTIESIEDCENDLLDEREMFWIKFYNSFDPDYGYNLTLGGEGSAKIDYDEVFSRYDNNESLGQISREMNISRSYLSQIIKEYDGYNKADAWERAMKDLSEYKGTPVSQYDLLGNFIATFPSAKAAERCVPKATHVNIRKSCNNKTGLSGGFQWRFANDDPPGAYVGHMPTFPKIVFQMDTSYNILSTFASSCEAARITGIDQSSISRCCNNHRNYLTAGGYIWRYEEDYYKKETV